MRWRSHQGLERNLLPVSSLGFPRWARTAGLPCRGSKRTGRWPMQGCVQQSLSSPPVRMTTMQTSKQGRVRPISSVLLCCYNVAERISCALQAFLGSFAQRAKQSVCHLRFPAICMATVPNSATPRRTISGISTSGTCAWF